jgi:uncharacterized membrane protein
MDWLQPMDEYCERLDASFWSEPLNALSNLSFIVAGLVLLVEARRHAPQDRVSLLLALNVIAVGIGSSLYHTLALRWAMLADVVPITVFIVFYLAVALRRFLGLQLWAVAGLVIAFLAASPFISSALGSLIGSTAAYAPALFAIFTVAAASAPRVPAIARGLFIAGLVFAASMTFRALDQPFCASNPLGTHMLWHLLNGLLLYLLVRLVLRLSARPATH